jgi:cytidylate kinase
VQSHVVCISRAEGADGEVVGRLVSERLGFRYLDEEIVARAAEAGGIDPELVAGAEDRKSLLSRVIEGFGRASVAQTPSEQMPKTEEHQDLIREVIRAVADEGNAVIVAHGASHELGGREAVLRVFVTAPPESRARRLAKDGLDSDGVAKRMRQGDLARADYLKRFYGVDRELPSHYDLVVNTETLGAERAAALIVEAARG